MSMCLVFGTAYMKVHFKFVWERFATAIKIDRIPLFDVSRHCDGHGVIERFTPRRDFFYRSHRPLLKPAAGLNSEP
jgi:hypothetical protein